MIKKIIIINEKIYNSTKYWSIVGISDNAVKIWFIPILLKKSIKKNFKQIFYFLLTANQIKVIDKTNCFWNLFSNILICETNRTGSKMYEKKYIKFRNSLLYNISGTNLENSSVKSTCTKTNTFWCIIKTVQNFNIFKNKFIGAQSLRALTPNSTLKHDFKSFFSPTQALDKKNYESLRKIFLGGDNTLYKSGSINPSFYDINSHYAYCMLGLVPSTFFLYTNPRKNVHVTHTLGFYNFLVKGTRHRLTAPTMLLKLLLKCGLKIKLISMFTFCKKYIFKNRLFWYFYITYVQNVKQVYQTYYKSSLVLFYGWTGLKQSFVNKPIVSYIYIPITVVSQATLYLSIFKNNNKFIYTDTDSFLLDKPLNAVFQHNSIGGLKTVSNKLILKYVFSQKFYFIISIDNKTFNYRYAIKSFHFNFKKSLSYQFFDNAGGFNLTDSNITTTKLSSINFQLSNFHRITSLFFRDSYLFKKN